MNDDSGHSLTENLQKNRRSAALGLALALALPLPAQSAPEVYTIDPAHTFPQFEVSHLGFSRHRGRFNSTTGQLVLDREARQGSVVVDIDSGSIDTGDAQLENILKSDGFFDVEKHPKLTYQSTGFVFVEDQLVAVDGQLTLLGVTRSVRLEIDHFHCGIQLLGLKQVCGANASARFLRSDFGMGKFTWAGLGDEVRVTIQIEARREASAKPANPESNGQ